MNPQDVPRRMHAAGIAGLIAALVSLVSVLFVRSEADTHYGFYSPVLFLDAPILVVLALMALRRHWSACLGLLVYFVLTRLWLIYQLPRDVSVLGVSIIFFYIFFQGAMAGIQYQRSGMGFPQSPPERPPPVRGPPSIAAGKSGNQPKSPAAGA